MYSGCRIQRFLLHKSFGYRDHHSDSSRFSFGRYDGPIVISGISGRFPNAVNTTELTTKLLAGEELTTQTTERWDDQTLPKRFGFLQNLHRFDAGFFGIPPRQADGMDPQTRLLLEVVFEAIVDAGMNPTNFRGSRTGVFCAAYGEESHDLVMARINRDERSYFMTGGAQYMIPGRIAFHFDLRGPSMKLCTACSSSFTALEAAVLNIQCGKCDAAIVTGSNLHLNNYNHKNAMAINALAPDGRCKTFDKSGDGFVRSEAAVAILVQKESSANRNYLRIRNIRSNTDGFKNTGITYPDRHSIANLMKETYEECGIDPLQVSYIEAHGTGTPAGDPEEFNAIHKVFCQGPSVRKKPLLVGSVKTNIGHTECAAGLSGIAKVIGAMQTGTLPGNLFFREPNPQIEPLLDGTVEVLTKLTPFDRGVVGICSSGVGGTNSHLVLEAGRISECKSENQLPVIVPFSGRSEAQVESSIVQALDNVSNPEYVYLLHTAFQGNIPGHVYKGFGLQLPNNSSSLKNGTNTISVQRCDVVDRPVWAIFPGMGAQWNEMGKDLMRIEPFANSISESRATLHQLGVDLDQLLAADNSTIFTNINHAFLSITAMQIALWDTLSALGISADGFIGHSAGEGLCAYADGCLSAEETLVVADARGRAMMDHQTVDGVMVAVGMSASKIRPRLPPGVHIACENTRESVTLAGERDLLTKFAKQLKAEGILNTMVDSCGIAPHCQHVQEAAHFFKTELTSILKGDRLRGSRWISTSIPEAEWDSDLGRFASAEYFRNNVEKPVLFSQALEKIPHRSLVIEISPKGFFQSLLNEGLPADCVHVAPMAVRAKDKLVHFFESVGKVYLSGVNLKMEKLYPSVPLPVSSNTPSLSPLVQWDHSETWKTGVMPLPADLTYESVMNLEIPEYAYLRGHKIDGRVLMPATGYLHSIWMQFAENFGRDYQNFPVRFRDVSFKRPTILKDDVPTKITYFLQSSTGTFHIESGGDVVVTGQIERLLEETEQMDFLSQPDLLASAPIMLKEDIYKEFRLRGYDFDGDFQSVEAMDPKGTWADIKWKDNWTCFLDAMMQTNGFKNTQRNLVVPTDVECVTIDPREFKRQLHCATKNVVRTGSLPNQKMIVAPGITIKGYNNAIIPHNIEKGHLSYESYSFFPFFNQAVKTPELAFSELIDLVLDNTTRAQLKVFDVFQNADNSLAFQFHKIVLNKPQHESKVSMITLPSEETKIAEKFKTYVLPAMTIKNTPEELIPEEASDLVFIDEPKQLFSISQTLKEGGFVIVQSSSSTNPGEIDDLQLVSLKTIGSKTLSLLRKVREEAKTVVQVSVDKEEFQWIPELQEALANAKDDNRRIYLTSQGNATSGILGLTNCIRREENGSKLRCIFDPEGKLELNFKRPDAHLQSIISQDLAVNVIREGQLGSYRHVSVSHFEEKTTEEASEGYVSTIKPGDLSSLRWIEFPTEKFTPGLAPKNYSDHETYKVAYAALNFRDVLLASRSIPLDNNFSYKGVYLGQEFSGFDEKGTRVMGLASGVGLATKIYLEPKLITKVPDHWTMKEAATVPVVYYTVLYALHMRANIQPGQTILVHAGSGGVGQAAISVALAHGCKVFTTVGTVEKREFIKKKFPQIPDDQIGNSRDTSFEAQFMEVTNGCGLDVVLNSLAGEKLKASVRCLATSGKFLEIGVADAHSNTQMGMRPFLKNIDFSAILLQQSLFNPGKTEATLKKLLEDGISSGSVMPLPTHVFEHDQVEEAFRFMATAKHTGKLLIKIRDTLSKPLRIQVSRRKYFCQDKTYLIAGGLGGLGLEVANWMVERGALKLILTSRSGLTNGYQAYCLEKWRQAGASIEIWTADLSDKGTAEEFISTVASNLGGIINSTVALRDGAFSNQTAEMFREVSAPKAQMTAVLDELSRKYCPKLDLFVVFSSYSCGRGNPGQANYGWANSVMERICEKRKADGLHGLAIQWGPIGQVGIAQRLFSDKGDITLMGTTFQSIESCLKVLDRAILQKHSAVVSSGVISDKKETEGKQGGLLQRLQRILGIPDIKALDLKKNLNELGMDSIVAAELKQTLEQEYEISIKKEHLSMLTMGDLKAIGQGSFDGKSLGSTQFGGRGEDIYVPFQLHDKPIVQLKSDPKDRQVFIVHGSDGGSYSQRPLAAKLNTNVYAFQMAAELEWSSISELAAQYIQEMKKIQPIGPYTIFGYSAGCTIAYQMAQQLKSSGEDVQGLVFLDGSSRCSEYSKSLMLEHLNAMNWLDKIPKDRLKVFLDSDSKDLWPRVIDLIKDTFTIGRAETQVYKKLFSELVKHVPQGEYDGDVLVLYTSDFFSDLSPTNCTGVVTRLNVRGDHRTFLTEAFVHETANIINLMLENL